MNVEVVGVGKTDRRIYDAAVDVAVRVAPEGLLEDVLFGNLEGVGRGW